jgi:hypothetical protein
MEDVLITWRELLRNEWLSSATDINLNTVPGVLGRPIKAWWHGDREVITANDVPVVVVDSESMTPEWDGFRVQEQNYNFDVLCYVRESDADDSKTVCHEMARIIKRISEKQSRWWIFSECLFDKEIFYDPQHLISNHTAILSPYLTEVDSSFTLDWIEQHTAYDGGPSEIEVPTLDQNSRYVAAYLKLFYEDPLTDSWTKEEFKYTDKEGNEHTTTPGALISLAREEEIIPARYISDCKIKNINYGYAYKGAELLYGAQISMYAKEQVSISQFGPM